MIGTYGSIDRETYLAVRRKNRHITASEAATMARQYIYPDGSRESPEDVWQAAMSAAIDPTIRWGHL